MSVVHDMRFFAPTQDSLAVLLLQPLWSSTGFSAAVIVDLFNLPLWARILMVIRALRPLQIITVIPSLRQVISEVLEGWPHLLRGLVITFGFMYMYSSLGLQVGKSRLLAPHMVVASPATSFSTCSSLQAVVLTTHRHTATIPMSPLGRTVSESS